MPGFAMTPLLFLAGAMFPLSGLPHRLMVICLADPLTYALDPLRRAVAAHAPAAAAPASASGRQLPVAAELGITAALAATALAVAAHRFARPGQGALRWPAGDGRHPACCKGAAPAGPRTRAVGRGPPFPGATQPPERVRSHGRVNRTRPLPAPAP
ncbi:hypothetical protein [Streptosporangium nondiastaticum]|uniref:hypothetical protein n=1 Tax=Streptosporangium nondiastaticum TaxID=35764 RepID=UPI002570FCFF|nr:hypothetical protein [Streptosporangium nondiastaticum]